MDLIRFVDRFAMAVAVHRQCLCREILSTLNERKWWTNSSFSFAMLSIPASIAARSPGARSLIGWLEAIDLVLLRAPVLNRASEPLPTPLGTPDAIHLAAALIWRERMGVVPTIATHDSALGLAARTLDFDVRGI